VNSADIVRSHSPAPPLALVVSLWRPISGQHDTKSLVPEQNSATLVFKYFPAGVLAKEAHVIFRAVRAAVKNARREMTIE